MAFVRFQELKVYALAEKASDEIWRIVKGWDNLARDTVGKQLVRAIDSVGANIAEGSGRGSRADNRRFVYIARGSFNETQHWLRRAFRRQLLTTEEIASLQQKMERLGPKLNAYLSPLAKKNSSSTPVTGGDAEHQTKPETLNTKPSPKH